MDNFPLKRGRGRPKGSKNTPPIKSIRMEVREMARGETKIGHMLCARFSFKNLIGTEPVIIICHNAYPSHTEIPGKYRCPDLDSCLVRWSRAKEQREFQEKKV